MGSVNSMLPPVPVPRDIREAVDRAVEEAGVTQAEAVRQSLRFGVGRFIEAMRLANNRSPSGMRTLLKDFPPIASTRGWKAAVRESVRKKYGAYR